MKVTLARSAAPTVVAGYSPRLLGAFARLEVMSAFAVANVCF
jgi:hypothetical protein